MYETWSNVDTADNPFVFSVRYNEKTKFKNFSNRLGIVPNFNKI